MSLSEQLREAIRTYGSVYAVARDSGVSQTILNRFVRGERDLTLETAEKLTEFFGLGLHRVPPVYFSNHPFDGRQEGRSCICGEALLLEFWPRKVKAGRRTKYRRVPVLLTMRGDVIGDSEVLGNAVGNCPKCGISLRPILESAQERADRAETGRSKEGPVERRRAAESLKPMELSEADAVAIRQALDRGTARPKIRAAKLPHHER